MVTEERLSVGEIYVDACPWRVRGRRRKDSMFKVNGIVSSQGNRD